MSPRQAALCPHARALSVKAAICPDSASLPPRAPWAAGQTHRLQTLLPTCHPHPQSPLGPVFLPGLRQKLCPASRPHSPGPPHGAPAPRALPLRLSPQQMGFCKAGVAQGSPHAPAALLGPRSPGTRRALARAGVCRLQAEAGTRGPPSLAPMFVYWSGPQPAPPPGDPAARLRPARCSVMERGLPEDKELAVCFMLARC